MLRTRVYHFSLVKSIKMTVKGKKDKCLYSKGNQDENKKGNMLQDIAKR